MTLALYGKSRKRQGGLIFSAFMAIMVAALAGVAVISTAFAHHNTITAERQCDTSWSGSADYIGGSTRKLIVISDVVVNGTNYATGWSTGYTGSIITYNLTNADFWDGEQPTGTTIYMWDGTDGGWDIYSRSGAAGTFNASWSGTIKMYGLDTRDTNGPAAGGNVTKWNLEDSDSVTAPAAPTDCAKIIIKKVVSGAGASASQNFTAAVNNQDASSGEASGLPFSQNTPYTHTWDEGGDDNDDFDVTETVASGYGVVGTKVLAGNVSCPAANAAGNWDLGSPANASGGALDNMENGKTVTVCFWNLKLQPQSCTDAGLVQLDRLKPGSTPWAHDGTDTYPPIQVTANGTAGGTVNWTSTMGIELIIIKAGSGPVGYKTEDPNGAMAGSFNNDGMLNDGGQEPDISHVDFCGNPPQPSVSVTKDAPAATYNLGQSFAWTITATVTNGPTTSDYDIFDQVPSQFQINSVAVNDPHNNPDKLTCLNSYNVSCTLASGAATGSNYTITVNVTVKDGATCGPVTNSVRNSTNPYTGTVVATDIIDVEGCGDVTIEKSDTTETVDGGANIKWTIALNNNAAVAIPAQVYDANATLVSSTGCTATQPGGAGTVINCTVPAGNSGPPPEATLTVKTPANASTKEKCEGYTRTNVAYLLNPNNTSGQPNGSDTSESGYATIPGVANALCITVTKVNTGNGSWTISFSNIGPQATVDMSDTYQPNSTGTNINSIGAPASGCSAFESLSVTGCDVVVPHGANSAVITVLTDPLQAKCESQEVLNTVYAYYGGNAVNGNGTSDNFVMEGDESKCTVDIEICKVWRLSSGEGFANPVPRAFSFQVNAETPFNIENVFESGPAVCEIVTVPASGATITESFPGAGWYTSHELNNDGETPVPMTNTAGGEGLSISLVFDGACYDTSEVNLVAEVTNLVRNIFSIQEAVAEGPLCTVTFYNEDPGQTMPTGDLRVEKYLDINGDGDANDPGEGPIDEWVVEVSGPEVNGQFPLSNNGTWDWLGLNSGDIYTVSELQQPGYQVTNTTVDGVSKGAVLFTFTTIPHGGTTVIRFYNQPVGGTIVAHKVAVTRHNAGPETPAPNDDDGWTITVTSVQCGINISKPTDGNGNAVFTGLPLCGDYVVSENPVNASSPGFSPVSPVSVSGQTPNGQTITFKNRKDTQDPPCDNCRGITPTPTVPTTPTTPPTTVVPPTTTPVPPTPVSTVQGERTPGASATPIAPSTGGGIIGGATGGTNLVLIFAGILALTSGLSFVALGRKSRR